MKHWLLVSVMMLSFGPSSEAGVGDLIVRIKGLMRPKATSSAATKIGNEALVFSEKSKKFIEEVGQDLTQKARMNPEFGNLQGREEEIKQMVTTLLTTGDVPNNILLQGPSGAGKTVLIQNLAHLISIKSDQISPLLHDYRIIEIDVNNFTQKSMQEQLSALKEFINGNPKVILFFDEMHTLTEVSKNGARENWVQNMLPLLLGTSLEQRAPFIGATMDKAVTKLTSIEGLARRIQVLNFKPVSVSEAFIILTKETQKIQKQIGVYISSEVLQDALALSARFNKDLAEPGATKELLNKVASAVKLYGSPLQNRLRQVNQKLTILQSQQGFLKSKKGPLYQYQKLALNHQIKRQMQLKAAIEQRLQKLVTSNSINRESMSSYIQYHTKISNWLAEVTVQTNPKVGEIRQTFAAWDQKIVKQLSAELQQDYAVLSQAQQMDPDLLVGLENFRIFFEEQINLLKLQVSREGSNEQVWMTTEDIIDFISKQNQINKEVLASSLGVSRNLVRNFERLSRQDIFEQRMMSDVLTQHLFKISKNRQNLNKAAGRFLFVGASGSGKTLAAQTLSSSLFGRDIKVFDMSAYQDSFSKSKLVGSPAGYVGYDAEPELFKQLRLFPDSVIIFDNIELAHPDVIKVLESLLSQKAMTSASDLFNVDLTRAVIVLTTRAGDNTVINSELSLIQKQNQLKSSLFQQNPQIFSSALMSQLDGVIKFELLSQQGLGHLLVKFWKSRQAELRKTQEIDIEISPEVFKHFFSRGRVGVDDLNAFLDELESSVLKNDPPKGSVIDVSLQGEVIKIDPATSIYQSAVQGPKPLQAAWRLREIQMSNHSWIQQLPREANFSSIQPGGQVVSADQPAFDPQAINNLRNLQNRQGESLKTSLPTETQPVRQ